MNAFSHSSQLNLDKYIISCMIQRIIYTGRGRGVKGQGGAWWRHGVAPVVLLLLGTLMSSCGASGQSATAEGGGTKLKVVATTSIVGDVVKLVAGDKADVTVMLAPGVNAHSYEPSPQDVKLVADADVVFSNGVGYEEFMRSLLENAGGDAQLVEVSEGIGLIAFEGEHEEEAGHTEGEADHTEGEGEHAEGGSDPHVWFNPQNVKVWTANIARKLGEMDSANAATYTANAETYSATLDELDTWAKQQVAQIPQERRKLVTDHDTFGYLAQHYDFELIGEVLPSISSSAEPSAQQIADIIEIIRANNVPAVFVANEVNTSLAKQVSEDTGAKLVPVYVESLSETGGKADTYERFMRYNIASIVENLR